MPTLLDFLPRWGEALCCRSIARMAPHVLCSLSYSRHPCCSLDLVSVTEHVAQTAQPQGLLSSKLNQVRPFHGTSVGKQLSPSQALSACTHPPSHTHTHTCGGWPAGYSLLVTDLVGTQLCQGHSLWMSHAQPSQLSEAPFPQSPTPSLDSPPSHHGNSSRSFFGASGTPPC